MLKLIFASFIFTFSLMADDKLQISKKGELLFEETFEHDQLPKRLKLGKGDWQMVGKSIKGKQLKEDKHTAFRKMFLNHQNVIYQFDFKFEGKAYAKFMINYDLVHLANCTIKANELSITKLNESKKRKMMEDKARKEGKPIEKGDWQKKNMMLDSKKISLKKNQWYTLTIESVEDQMVATLGNFTVKGKHPGLKETKTNFGIQVAGLSDYVHFDNLRIWKAEKK
jgi:hypothetical protein